jgi:hypothetical protein
MAQGSTINLSAKSSALAIRPRGLILLDESFATTELYTAHPLLLFELTLDSGQSVVNRGSHINLVETLFNKLL